MPEAARKAAADALKSQDKVIRALTKVPGLVETISFVFTMTGLGLLFPLLPYTYVLFIPTKLGKIRKGGGAHAAELARFITAAELWAVLMIGSGLALAAVIIQLVQAYQ